MSDHEIKGFALQAGFRWVEQRFGAEKRRAFEQDMPPHFQQQLPWLRAQDWYPIAWIDALFNRIALEAGEDTEEKIALVKQGAAFISEENLTTVMKLLVKFLTPETVIRHFPKMWARYVRGPIALEAEVIAGSNRAVLTVTGFGPFRWFGPCVCAWLETAYRLLGADDIQVREVLNDPADEHPSDFRWELEW